LVLAEFGAYEYGGIGNRSNLGLMRSLFLIFVSLFLAVAHPVAADDHRPVVVELYTSQGCSSCPPADALLTKLSGRDDVIALALHVDYWDYLGWEDAFASADYSARQRAYAKAAHKRTVYTPQVIVQGVGHAVGNRVDDVEHLIAYHKNRAKAVDIELERSGSKLFITATAEGGSVGRAVIQIVRYVPEKTVSIEAGENAGRKIVYTNIVTEWRPLTQWNGRGTITANTVVTGAEPIVVLVQSLGLGPIIAAEVLR